MIAFDAMEPAHLAFLYELYTRSAGDARQGVPYEVLIDALGFDERVTKRIQRALEVWRLTGKPLSALQGAAKSELPFALKGIAILPDREVLKHRIEKRFQAMLRLGLIDEVKQLKRKYRLSSSLPSMRAVGYRQVWEYLEGHYDKETLTEKAVTATRQLAKRQLTWLRSFPDLVRLDAGGAEDPAVALHLLLDEGRQLLRG